MAKKREHSIRLPLGRGANIVITYNRSTVKTANKKKSSKSKSSPVAKKRDLAVTATLLVGGFFGSIFFGIHVMAAAPTTSLVSDEIASKQVAPPARHPLLPRSVPTRVTIPNIEVDAPITSIGLNADGTLQVPKQPEEAGWYSESPTPGERGPSIIDGHLDKVDGIAVFWRLRELTPGQSIEITRADGTKPKFVINRVKQFSQDSFPTKEIYGDTDYASLRLITCGGVFDEASGHYSDNTVIFASLIPSSIE